MDTNTPRPEDNARTASRPSELKITDMRTATVGWNHWHFTIVRIDTNQGISGYGEVRDFASKNYALMLKSRLLGENPCNVDKLFRRIKQFGHHGRQAGGVCGVEMALMDLAGKAYGIPAYVLAGGKFRDRVRMYCDTPNEPTGTAMGKKLQERIDRGFTMLKMDVGVQPLIGEKGMLSWPQGMLPGDPEDKLDKMLNIHQLQHPFTHVRLTPKGIDSICQYVAEVREVVGDEVPGLDLGGLGHELLVDGRSAGGVENDDVVAAEAGRVLGPAGDLDRGLAGDDRQRVDLCLLAEDAELLLGGGAPGVQGRHEDLATVAVLQAVGNFGRGRRLARTLQADHEDADRWGGGEVDRVGVRTQHLDKLVMDDLDDHLARLDRLEDSGADGLCTHAVDEGADDIQRDVGLEQRAPHLAHRLPDIALGEGAATGQLVEDARQPVGKILEQLGHGRGACGF